MVAGTSTMRTTVASMRIAVARPSPNILVEGSSVTAKDRKTATMMRAADVMIRAVPATPSTIAVPLSPVRTYSSRTRERRNTS